MLKTGVSALFDVEVIIDGPLYRPVDNTEQMNESLQSEIPDASTHMTPKVISRENEVDTSSIEMSSENQDALRNQTPKKNTDRDVENGGNENENEYPEVFCCLAK